MALSAELSINNYQSLFRNTSLLGFSPAILHSPYCLQLQHSVQPLPLHGLKDPVRY